jgi:hypothetical protein
MASLKGGLDWQRNVLHHSAGYCLTRFGFVRPDGGVKTNRQYRSEGNAGNTFGCIVAIEQSGSGSYWEDNQVRNLIV